MSTTKYKQDLDVTGNITLSGNVTADGTVILGDADTDSISLNADITSNIIPDVDITYDLGSTTKTWREVFTSKVNSAVGDDLDLHSGADIALYPTGNIWIKQDTKLIFEGTVPDDFEIKLQALAATADRDIILPDASGTLALNEKLQDGTFDLDVNSFTVSGSGNTSIAAGANIELNATNRVLVTDTPFRLASFTTVERDAIASPINGDMIYNTTTNKFQGYANSAWVDLH
jgi:hypothetical protein